MKREEIMEVLETIKTNIPTFDYTERTGTHAGEFIATNGKYSVILRGNLTRNSLRHYLKRVGVIA